MINAMEEYFVFLLLNVGVVIFFLNNREDPKDFTRHKN